MTPTEKKDNDINTVKLASLMAQSSGIASIKIGLVDGPVNVQHTDFSNLNLLNKSAGCTSIDSPACQHGTFIAGMLAADRKSPALGLCPSCTIISESIFCEAELLDQCPIVTSDDLALVLRKMMRAGANIINMSIGLVGAGNSACEALFKVYDEARARGVLLVGASGNQAGKDVNPLFKHPWVIVVAACQEDGGVSAMANTGPWVAQYGLLAPGVNIVSTASGGGYRRMSGTSAATPFVTATLALLWSLYPDLNAEDLYSAILQTNVPRSRSVPLLLDAEKSQLYIEEHVTRNTQKMDPNVEQVMTFESEKTDYEQDENFIVPQECACGSEALGLNNDIPLYVYAVGTIKPVFPALDVQKEFETAAKKLKLAERDFFGVFSAPGAPYWYIAEQMCWVLSINNIDTYAVIPRSPAELDDLIKALKPATASIAETLTVIIGQKGPLAPAGYCNGLQLPMVVCNQLYYFTLDELLGNLQNDGIDDEAIRDVIKSLEFKPNDGSSGKDRALNYLAFRYPEIYRKTASLKGPKSSSGQESQFLVDIKTKLSDIQTERTIVDVIFKYQGSTTGAISRWYCGVDVSGQFPFLCSPLQSYVEISS